MDNPGSFANLHPPPALRGFYAKSGKRFLDLLIGFPLCILAAPLLLAAALAVRLSSPGPIFYRQTRVGTGGQDFTLLKFRTLYHRGRDPSIQIASGSSEAPPAGLFMRRFKIDELPQLLHVLSGKMSLVGPRPALREVLDFSNPDCLARTAARPGLTGLAQVSGNIALSWPQRWVYDARYVRECSFVLDLKILLRSLLVVLAGESRFLSPPT